jgi:hypothetical protein
MQLDLAPGIEDVAISGSSEASPQLLIIRTRLKQGKSCYPTLLLVSVNVMEAGDRP